MLFFILRTEVEGAWDTTDFLPAMVLSWFQRLVTGFMCPQAQVVGVPPHFEEPAKPRRTIFLRVLFQKWAGLWKKEPRKAQ
jgi:hypothetical protein